MKFYQSSAALLAGLLFTSQIPLMANEQEEPVRLAEQTVDVQTFVDELTGEQDQPVFEQEDGILVQESESLQSEDQSLEESEPLQSEDQNLFEEGEVLLQTNDSQKEQSMETSAPLAPADQPDEPLSMDQDSSTQSAKNGWVEQNGYLFYFDQGKKLTGAQQINGKSYYFSEDGSLGYGFVNNGFYNYKDGSLASGLIFVDGNTYYVLDDGTLAMDQEVWFDGALHYFDGNGQLIKGFFRDDTETAYYSWLDGSRLSGVQFYDDQLYVLGQYGPQNTGLINVNGTEYWQKADGTVARNEFLEIDGINF